MAVDEVEGERVMRHNHNGRTYPADKMIPPSVVKSCKTSIIKKTVKKRHNRKQRYFQTEGR